MVLKKNINSSYTSFLQYGVFYSNARSALANALTLSGVNKESSILMPAYHCGSMIEPALWLNANVLLYRLNKDLIPESDHIEQLISKSQKPVKVMLLPHYFGFLQDVRKWRKFCDQHNLILIEDCAHAFFGQLPDSSLVGKTGDYAIASVKKIFCTQDGGILIGKNVNPHNFSLKKTRIGEQLHGILNFIQQLNYYGRLGKPGIFFTHVTNCYSTLKFFLSSKKIGTLTAEEKTSLHSWKWFVPDLVNICGFAFSHWLMTHSNLERIVCNRRKNYLTLLTSIKKIKYLEPLFPTLPENVIPYMFPVLLKSGEADFDRLKKRGMPIWRWEELAESDCTVSQSYRLQLLHLPCHQELKSSEITWMLNTLEQILGKK